MGYVTGGEHKHAYEKNACKILVGKFKANSYIYVKG
jgi:hypothetical protein